MWQTSDFGFMTPPWKNKYILEHGPKAAAWQLCCAPVYVQPSWLVALLYFLWCFSEDTVIKGLCAEWHSNAQQYDIFLLRSYSPSTSHVIFPFFSSSVTQDREVCVCRKHQHQCQASHLLLSLPLPLIQSICFIVAPSTGKLRGNSLLF